MTTRATAKKNGSSWERQCAEYLAAGVFPLAERAPRWGSIDKGDLVNTGDFTFECKSVRSIDLASFVDEATTEAMNAGKCFGVALVKRRGKGDPGEGYAVMKLSTLTRIIELLEDHA